MRIDSTFLGSRVARRIFALFVCCAILPIAVLSLLSFRLVTKQINEQSERRLHQASKSLGLALFERLLFLEAQLTRSRPVGRVDPGERQRRPAEANEWNVPRHFRGMVVVGEGGKHSPMSSELHPPVELTPTERHALNLGKTAVLTRVAPGLPSRIFLARSLVPDDPGSPVLLGEIDPTYLWGTDEEGTLPPDTELCVLAAPDRVLMCTLPIPPSSLQQAGPWTGRSTVVRFQWQDGDQEYMASAWSIFLQGRFSSPEWIVVLSESKADVLAPITNFKATFPPVIFLSLCVVLLLSLSQIRRTLVPLEKLQEGTQRIAARDFDSRVTVTSGDEFEKLAASFNRMAQDLGRQFNALTTMAEITQAVLSSLDTKQIVDTAITRLRDLCPCDRVGVILMDSGPAKRAVVYLGEGGAGSEILAETLRIAPEDTECLRANPKTVVREDQEVPPYLVPFARLGIKSFVVLPIFLKHHLSALIVLGYLNGPPPGPDDLAHARQLADQVAVALSNARLIEELDQLNWGTLTALARTIDAKSPWTAGHSERVTKLALEIGRVLGLTPRELGNLQRGGLLHDIGKIGIPAALLDKHGKLTDEERRIMQEHVRLGARILEPIAAYAEVIPIVLQHHELFDGTGYPDGLAGEAISFGARIFSVADVYDALSSPRPYRAALGQEEVMAHIEKGNGRQFDPKVVEAFLQVMARRAGKSTHGHTPVFAG